MLAAHVAYPLEQNSSTLTILLSASLVAIAQVIAYPLTYWQVGLLLTTVNTLLGISTYILAPLSIGLVN